ncbi:MAG: outer membrane protein assembly factor BamA [bacterium]
MFMLQRGLCLVVLFVVGTAFGETVKKVTVRALDKFGTDATDVLQYCSVKEGDSCSQEELTKGLSKDVRTLLDTERFEDVSAEVETGFSDGIHVIYSVKRRYRFQEPISIRGNDYMSESKVRKYAELKNGDPIDEQILASKVSKIRDEYIKRYYRNIKVSVVMEPMTNSVGSAQVTLIINEGAREKIHAFKFLDNPSIDAEELRYSFGDLPWYDPRGWFSENIVTEQALEDARQQAEDVYQNKGFLDATVASPVSKKVGDEKVDMIFKVTEGDSYTTESTAIRGVKLFPENDVLAGSRMKKDMVCGRQAVNDAAKDIQDYYGSRGYVDTVVRPLIDPVPGRPGRAMITFEVHEGQLAYIRNVVIRGNNETKDKVIRREVLVSPGEILNEVRAERSEARLKNLGYFSEVRHYNEKTDDPGKRDLVYEVKEQRTGNFMVGLGISTVDSIFGYGEISQSNFDILNWPNFKGAGQKARMGVEYGPRRQTAEASWTEPWLFNRPLALTVEMYRRMRWFDQYDETRTGANVGLSYPVLVGRLGFRYTLEQVEMDDVKNGEWFNDPNVLHAPGTGKNFWKDQENEYSGNLNSIGRIYWSTDTRDQAFVPTRGYQSMIFGDLSEGFLGENEFYRVGLSHRHWFAMPWWKHVLSLRGRAETVDAYSGELPVYESLFLGGPRTIRGVEYRGMGPKIFADNSDHYSTTGGKSLIMATAEYTIPVFKAVRLAVFTDAGSLGDDAFGKGMNGVCVAAGVGLRIDIPGFPIRFDLAKPFITDDDYTNEEIFSFSIGFE